jgi:hypothetical protein
VARHLLVAIVAGLVVSCGSGAISPTTVSTRGPMILDLTVGATSISVRAAALSPGLYRISAAPGAVRASRNGNTVVVRGRGSSSLTIEVDASRRWDLLLNGGSTTEVVDMRAGGLAGLHLEAGAYRMDLLLGRPTGSVPIVMTGGADLLQVALPSGGSATVHLRNPVDTVVVDGARTSGSAGQILQIGPRSHNRYDIDCQAGLSELSVTS